VRWRWRRSSERKSPQLGAVKVLPTFEDGVAVRMEDCDRYLVEDNLAALVGKRSQTNEGMGKDGMTWPNIVAGGRAETEARLALVTEHSGHPFATVTLMVGARGL
jgi:hypothetical protein